MDTAEVERLLEEAIPDAEATVTLPRVHQDEDHEDAHFAAVVVSPVFEGETLVQQHQRVYDALDGHMTTDIHALEIQTFTPEEYEEHGRPDS
jgi:stress-induced morphogen